MTFAEFCAEVRAIAAGRYCSATVEATMNQAGGDTASVVFKAYIDGRSWTEAHRNPATCLDELRGLSGDEAINAVGTVAS